MTRFKQECQTGKKVGLSEVENWVRDMQDCGEGLTSEALSAVSGVYQTTVDPALMTKNTDTPDAADLFAKVLQASQSQRDSPSKPKADPLSVMALNEMKEKEAASVGFDISEKIKLRKDIDADVDKAFRSLAAEWGAATLFTWEYGSKLVVLTGATVAQDENLKLLELRKAAVTGLVPKAYLLDAIRSACSKVTASDAQKDLVNKPLFVEFSEQCKHVEDVYLQKIQDVAGTAPVAVKEGVEFAELYSLTDVNHRINTMTSGVASSEDVKRVQQEFQPFLDSLERLKEWLKTSLRSVRSDKAAQERIQNKQAEEVQGKSGADAIAKLATSQKVPASRKSGGTEGGDRGVPTGFFQLDLKACVEIEKTQFDSIAQRPHEKWETPLIFTCKGSMDAVKDVAGHRAVIIKSVLVGATPTAPDTTSQQCGDGEGVVEAEAVLAGFAPPKDCPLHHTTLVLLLLVCYRQCRLLGRLCLQHYLRYLSSGSLR